MSFEKNNIKNIKIGNVILKNVATLAPMAGVTDRAFREICSEFGVGCFTSEMVSTKGLIYDSKKTFSLIEHSNLERPFAVQLFGNNPKDFYESVNILLNKYQDIDIIDINMGCPATKIIKENSGSALMKDSSLCGQIVKSCKDSVMKINKNIPVTVKIRAGWDNNNLNAPEIAKICEQSGADLITVHGRTRQQEYSGTNNLDIIKQVKNSVNIPVIGNGDINSTETANFMLEYTNCDLIAIGRGAMGNPWIFKNINQNSNNIISMAEKVRVMKLHINKLCKYKSEEIGIKEARKHMSAYLKNFPNACEFRKKVFSTQTKQELLNICEELI